MYNDIGTAGLLKLERKWQLCNNTKYEDSRWHKESEESSRRSVGI
jgi:hypothetical protein